MKLPKLIFFILGMATSLLAFAADFSDSGVKLVIPAGFEEEKSTQPDRPGYSKHAWVRTVNGATTIAIHLYITTLTEESKALGETLTNAPPLAAAESALVVALDRMRMFIKDIKVSEGRQFSMSGKIGVMAIFSGTALPSWDNKPDLGDIRARIYCVAEPARTIFFHVYASRDPTGTYANEAISAVEKATIVN
jgi:hypothetical protein